MPLDCFGGRPDASYRLREALAGHAKLLGPIFDLIIFLEANEFGVLWGALRLFVRHGDLPTPMPSDNNASRRPVPCPVR
jgi:hypothetical protein